MIDFKPQEGGFTMIVFFPITKMARVVSRKSCMKRVSRRLHKRATTKRQHQKVIGKASKACSRKMRVRRAGKKVSRKPGHKTRHQTHRQPPSSPTAALLIHSRSPPSSVNTSAELSAYWSGIYNTHFGRVSCQNMVTEVGVMRDALDQVIMDRRASDEQVDAFQAAVMDMIERCPA
jgi:hypothetical protein